MDWLSALILGIVQGLTEFLPVSSSGHLEIGKVLLGIDATQTLAFTVAVHGATVLSIIVVFYKDIRDLIIGLLEFRWNEATRFFIKICISMIPVIIVGLFFKEEVETLFTGQVRFVGFMLVITAIILWLAGRVRSGQKNIPWTDAFIIGVAQAIAVLPGISRSGATIATGLLLKNQKELVTRFSFLMVIIPILGANFLDIHNGEMTNSSQVNVWPIIIGFAAAFITGTLACKWMVEIIQKGRLVYFSIYCLILGLIAIIFTCL